MNEPKIAFTNDVVTWNESLADYPASTYTMKYEFNGPGTLSTITGVPNGNTFDFTLNLASAVQGEYFFRGYVECASPATKLTVTYGSFDVRDIATSTYAKTILDSIDLAISNFVTDGGVVSLSIQGRSQTFTTLADLTKAREYWKAQVVKHNKQIAIAQGRQKNTRFFRSF